MRAIHRYTAFVLNVINASGLQIKNLPKTANEGIRNARDREVMNRHNLFLTFCPFEKARLIILKNPDASAGIFIPLETRMIFKTPNNM